MVDILRSVGNLGRLLGLDQSDNLVLGGTKIYYGHNTNADGVVDLTALGVGSTAPGYIVAETWPGFTKGTGLSTATRQANAVALQAAIDFCAANGLAFVLTQTTYEIYSATGLLIRAGFNGFVWRGSPRSSILQCCDNAPILTIGDTSATPSFVDQIDFSGVKLDYLNDQSANTSANRLVMGAVYNSKFSCINAASAQTGTGPPPIRAYRDLYIPGNSNNFFNNTLQQCAWGGGAFRVFDVSGCGEGCSFIEHYIQGGTIGHAATYSVTPVAIANCHEMNFIGFKVDALSGNTIWSFNNCFGVKVQGTHLEGNVLTGASPRLFRVISSNVHFDCTKVYNTLIQSSQASGNPSLFSSFAQSSIVINELDIKFDSSSYVTLAPYLFNQVSADGLTDNQTPIAWMGINISGDNGLFAIDPNLPTSSFGGNINFIPRGFSGEPNSYTDGIVMKPTVAAAFTLYGAHRNAYIKYPAALTGATSITLSALVGPTGTRGDAVPAPRGNLVTVVRQSGTQDSNNLTVYDTDGTTVIGTINGTGGSATSQILRFNLNSVGRYVTVGTADTPPGGGVDVQTFTNSGTWNKPAGAPKTTRILIVGGGGGGGGGAQIASGTAMSGGAGGGGGYLADIIVPTASLGGTETVTIGAGGTAGTAGSGGAGGTGGVGGNSTFGSWATGFGGGPGQGGASAAASGGGGGAGGTGQGGTGSAGTGGSSGAPSTGSGGGGSGAAGSGGSNGPGGGAGCASAGAGLTGGSSQSNAPTGGGSGAGLAASPSAQSGGNSGKNNANQTAAAGGAANTVGTAGTAAAVYAGGLGGGGGGSSTSGAAGAGGAGARGGGGGGGGSALTSTATAAAGGVGGAGYCVVITTF